MTAAVNTQGRLTIVGLGPGGPEYRLPIVNKELEKATDILGYHPYIAQAGPFRADQRVQGSDNREEMARAHQALQLAAQGRRVVMVSSGDPGIFAMAAAVVEALAPQVRAVELVILPGISAAQLAAAKVGAPLGHDFCVLSLSDNLKPWSQIEKRLRLAAEADLVMALYNPRSRARPQQFIEALAILRSCRAPQTPVVLGREVGRAGEQLVVTSLAEVDPEQVDMRTVLIIGSSQTRVLPRQDDGQWVYTPRWYPDSQSSA